MFGLCPRPIQYLIIDRNSSSVDDTAGNHSVWSDVNSLGLTNCARQDLVLEQDYKTIATVYIQDSDKSQICQNVAKRMKLFVPLRKGDLNCDNWCDFQLLMDEKEWIRGESS